MLSGSMDNLEAKVSVPMDNLKTEFSGSAERTMEKFKNEVTEEVSKVEGVVMAFLRGNGGHERRL